MVTNDFLLVAFNISMWRKTMCLITNLNISLWLKFNRLNLLLVRLAWLDYLASKTHFYQCF